MFTTFCILLALWTLLEGGFALLFPAASLRLTKIIFPKSASIFEGTPLSDLRKIGAIETLFGVSLLLGVQVLSA